MRKPRIVQLGFNEAKKIIFDVMPEKYVSVIVDNSIWPEETLRTLRQPIPKLERIMVCAQVAHVDSVVNHRIMPWPDLHIPTLNGNKAFLCIRNYPPVADSADPNEGWWTGEYRLFMPYDITGTFKLSNKWHSLNMFELTSDTLKSFLIKQKELSGML